MTVVEFKNRIAKAFELAQDVKCLLYWTNKEGAYYLVRDYGPRKVSILQTQRYAFKTEKLEKGQPTGKMVDSWSDFPKAKDLKEIDANTVEVYFEFGKLVYTLPATS